MKIYDGQLVPKECSQTEVGDGISLACRAPCNVLNSCVSAPQPAAPLEITFDDPQAGNYLPLIAAPHPVVTLQ